MEHTQTINAGFFNKNSSFFIFVCLFCFVFLSFQQAINKTGTFIEDLRSDPTENRDINMLVAFQALESFSVDYGKIHSKVNESKVITQRSFGRYITNHREKHLTSDVQGEGVGCHSPSEVFLFCFCCCCCCFFLHDFVNLLMNSKLT